MTQKAKKELYEAGEEVVLGAVNSYIAEIQENGTAERYIMYGSTFFNSRWRDYVKEPEPRVEVTAEETEEKPILFGMYQCNLDNKTLILTEGQLDSLSVTESGIENAVSVPFGKNGFTWIPYCWDWMQNFDTLIVFGDCENGIITLLDEMRKRFRGTVKAVQRQDYRGCKDANELLCKYGKDTVRRAVNRK